jgi:hypothetical protein
MRPDDTGTRPAIMRNVVDLPQPDGPSSATSLPRGTINDKFSTAVNA